LILQVQREIILQQKEIDLVSGRVALVRSSNRRIKMSKMISDHQATSIKHTHTVEALLRPLAEPASSPDTALPQHHKRALLQGQHTLS
jgi:hypothetical protein